MILHSIMQLQFEQNHKLMQIWRVMHSYVSNILYLIWYTVATYMCLPPTRTHSLCCECGAPIEPNPANMCVACLRTRVDITEGIPKQAQLYFCKGCERWGHTSLLTTTMGGGLFSVTFSSSKVT